MNRNNCFFSKVHFLCLFDRVISRNPRMVNNDATVRIFSPSVVFVGDRLPATFFALTPINVIRQGRYGVISWDCLFAFRKLPIGVITNVFNRLFSGYLVNMARLAFIEPSNASSNGVFKVVALRRFQAVQVLLGRAILVDYRDVVNDPFLSTGPSSSRR